MTGESKEHDPLQWLPGKTLAAIEKAKSALERVLGDELESAFVVGSALNPARGDRASAPEIIAIVAPGFLRKMRALAEALSEPMRSGVRVRIVTHDELARSADVFALEIAEWKARHRVISGRDVLAKIDVQPAHLRHALELELRGLSRRIRNRVLAGVAAGPTRDDPARAVRDGLDRLLVAAHHVLVLAKKQAPSDEALLVDALGALVGVDAAPLRAMTKAIREAKQPPAPLDALETLSAAVDKAAAWVDAWEASS
ncbi:MAG: hypothetical protein JNK05_20230 [Myxococcales bacterium]|nr:hypothetical protein [Myxococcales bacterium]